MKISGYRTTISNAVERLMPVIQSIENKIDTDDDDFTQEEASLINEAVRLSIKAHEVYSETASVIRRVFNSTLEILQEESLRTSLSQLFDITKSKLS